MYRFTVGQRIKHTENNKTGCILKLVSFDEEEGVRVDVENPNVPWYDVQWDDNWVGFEHDLSLTCISDVVC